MQYDSGVYWFRDYWSNRLKLNRNIQAEDFKIDVEKDFFSKELTVDSALSGNCNVQSASNNFVNLVDPFKLAHQYEPHRISFKFNKSGLRDELPDPNYKINDKQIKNVIEEPIMQSKGELTLWQQFYFRVIIPSFLFMLAVWVAMGYIVAWFPQLIRFNLFIMAFSLVAFLYLTVRVFVKTGISEKTRKVEGAKATIYLYDGREAEKVHYRSSKDKPNWLESKPYWVFRYLYRWRAELTLSNGIPFIHAVKDIERLEVWLDAKTGTIEWIVSDYHWRELWYRADPNLSEIRIWLASNFHTPRPLNISIDGKGTLADLYRKGNPLSKEWMKNLENQRISHSKFVSMMFEKKNLGFIDKAIASELSGLWWEKLRYKKGADNEIYKTSDFSATGDQPNPPSLPPRISSILMPIMPAVILPVAPTQRSIMSPVLASTSLLSTSQTKDLAVEQTTTAKITLAPTYSPLSTKKHSGGFRNAGIAVGTIALVAVIGYFIIKKGKNPELVEKQAQTEKLSSN